MEITEARKSYFFRLFDDSITLETDGSSGLYRGPAEFNLSGANNDKDAIAAFISQYKNSPKTHSAYQRETERFHMWAVLQRGKSIPDLNIEDYQAFIEFLGHPDPEWLSMEKEHRSSDNWRPFILIRDESIDNWNELTDSQKKLLVRGLSTSARTVAVAAVGSLLNWLVDSGYMATNPLRILRQKDKALKAGRPEESKIKVSRFLDQDMWDAATRAVEAMPIKTHLERINYERVRFILTMFSMVAARVSELSNAKMGDIRRDPGGWFWHVVGKGDKEAQVPLPQDMVSAFMRWRKAINLTAIPSPNEVRPVIPSVNKKGKPLYKIIKKLKQPDGSVIPTEIDRPGLSPRRINEILKEVFIKASMDPKLAEDQRENILLASAHWLRHTSVTQKIDAGMDRFRVQADARHSDMGTTEKYIHDNEKERSAEAQKHKLRWAHNEITAHTIFIDK